MYICGLGSGLACYLSVGFRVLDMGLIVRLYNTISGLNVSLFQSCRYDTTNYYLEADTEVILEVTIDVESRGVTWIRWFKGYIALDDKFSSVYDHKKWEEKYITRTLIFDH